MSASLSSNADPKVHDLNREQAARPQTVGREPKNIVLCSDGTGNRGGKGSGTNVWALFNAVWRQPDADGKLPEKTQITFYDDGVGTQNFVVFKVLGGAFGWGYSRNIRELYKALVSAYEPGDSIYLFGFSRGAYTVRGLAGVILTQGILNRHLFRSSEDLDYGVKAVYRAYRNRYKSIATILRRWLRPGLTKAYEGYRQEGKIHHLDERKNPDTPLRFIGVWDTVDAVGLPIDKLTDALDWLVQFRFRDQNLHPNVAKACHAVSIDDERRTFWPVMWNEEGETEPKRIEQVWFPGVHSNVGGGYPKDHVARVALDWMMQKAEDAGLLFYSDVRTGVREAANAHGKLYDSRAGLAAYYRYHPRDIKGICDDSQAKVRIKSPKVHFSALRRIARATEDYAPANLPSDIRIVGSHKGDKAMADRLTRAFRATNDERAGGVAKVARVVGARRALYWCFLIYSLGLAGATAWFYWFATPSSQPTQEQTPKLVGYLFDGIEWLLPDFLLRFAEPLLDQARDHWVTGLLVVAVLLLFAGLKGHLENKCRRQALDAWRDFRERVYPPGVASESVAPENAAQTPAE